MADAHDDEKSLTIGEVLDDQYTIEAELGRGGIGVVYKALDRENQIPVAIKILLPKWSKDRKMKARFLREPRLAIRARHANIVQIYAVKPRKSDGTPYIVMEFIEGKQLLDLFSEARKNGVPYGVKILPLAGQLASVLAACHAKSIVHRDLKPANVMIVADEDVIGGQRVKLLDFGIAKVWEDEDDGVQTSMGDQQPGTPAYMSPEQIETMDKNNDPAKMDVYSLGVIVYESLAGRLPLFSRNRTGMLAMLASIEPDHLHTIDATLPEALVQLVHDMLSKEPARRPSMEQVRERLKSRKEVVSILPTRELLAIAPVSLTEISGVSITMDVPVSSAVGPTESTAPLVIKQKSVGEKSTGLQVVDSFDGAVSSIGRGTGQQLTEGKTRQRRRQRLRMLGLAGSLAAVSALGIGAWHFLGKIPTLPSQIAQPKETRPQPIVQPLLPAGRVETAALPAAPIADEAGPAVKGTETRTVKAKAVCVEVSESCIGAKATETQRMAIVKTIQDSKIRLCPTDVISVGPEFDVVGVKKKLLADFVPLLRGNLNNVPLKSQIVIKCPAR